MVESSLVVLAGDQCLISFVFFSSRQRRLPTGCRCLFRELGYGVRPIIVVLALHPAFGSCYIRDPIGQEPVHIRIAGLAAESNLGH